MKKRREDLEQDVVDAFKTNAPSHSVSQAFDPLSSSVERFGAAIASTGMSAPGLTDLQTTIHDPCLQREKVGSKLHGWFSLWHTVL